MFRRKADEFRVTSSIEKYVVVIDDIFKILNFLVKYHQNLNSARDDFKNPKYNIC